MGSGIVFKKDKENCYILTAGHVLEGSNEIFIYDFGNKVLLPARIISNIAKPGDSLDIGLIKTAKWDKELVPKLASEGFFIKQKSNVEFPVIIAGVDYFFDSESNLRFSYPIEYFSRAVINIIETKGRLLKIGKKKMKYEFIIKDVAKPGMSGGGVFNLKGEFMGTIFTGPCSLVTLAIPITTISDFLKRKIKN